MKRKYPSIDLLKLWSNPNNQTEWNKMLTRCLVNHDVEMLRAKLYGIQAGMDDLCKAKLNTEGTSREFLRLQRSIEQTMKKILAEKYPCLMDYENFYLQGRGRTKQDLMSDKENKKKRDQEFLIFLREASF